MHPSSVICNKHFDRQAWLIWKLFTSAYWAKGLKTPSYLLSFTPAKYVLIQCILYIHALSTVRYILYICSCSLCIVSVRCTISKAIGTNILASTTFYYYYCVMSPFVFLVRLGACKPTDTWAIVTAMYKLIHPKKWDSFPGILYLQATFFWKITPQTHKFMKSSKFHYQINSIVQFSL